MEVVIVDYQAGNVQSVRFALERLGLEPLFTADVETIRRADRVLLPGQGEAKSIMGRLQATGLAALIPTLKQPVLGICVGLQLLCAHSEEGDTPCLGVFSEQVRRFRPAQGTHIKVPHVGWNILAHANEALLGPKLEGEHAYFLHSYFAELGPNTAAVTDYVQPFSAALQHDNFLATQFHPEKSGTLGAGILKHFMETPLLQPVT